MSGLETQRRPSGRAQWGREKLRGPEEKWGRGWGNHLYQILRTLVRWGWKSDHYWPCQSGFGQIVGQKLNVTQCQKREIWLCRLGEGGSSWKKMGGSFLFFIVVKYTEHKIYCFKCAVHWCWIHSHCCIPITTIHLQNSPSQTETLSPLHSNPLFHCPHSSRQPPFYFLSLWLP